LIKRRQVNIPVSIHELVIIQNGPPQFVPSVKLHHCGAWQRITHQYAQGMIEKIQIPKTMGVCALSKKHPDQNTCPSHKLPWGGSTRESCGQQTLPFPRRAAIWTQVLMDSSFRGAPMRSCKPVAIRGLSDHFAVVLMIEVR
jgi:hypothetical protein